jgi:hypothetical protein
MVVVVVLSLLLLLLIYVSEKHHIKSTCFIYIYIQFNMPVSILHEKAFLTEEFKSVTKTSQMDEQGKAGNGREISKTNNSSRVVDQP